MNVLSYVLFVAELYILSVHVGRMGDQYVFIIAAQNVKQVVTGKIYFRFLLLVIS